jgi:hypothetical protein
VARRSLALLVLVVVAGCGGGSAATKPPERPPAQARSPERDAERSSKPRWPPAARCPAGLAGCRTARGTVLYVERVDPDGDGDAHLVLASSASISGPGITAVDIRAALRPKPLPGPGDRVSAAGPVYRGSFGQRQIEAVDLHVRRARRRR